LKIVGLTGGIGSGKTTIAKFFMEFGVGVYIADSEAKNLMHTDISIIDAIKSLFGEAAYKKEKLNRSFIAEKVFNNKILLDKLNAIVHPKVETHFKNWVQKQTGNYCIKEAAILFETGGNKKCDYVILVTAPKKLRISRVTERDNTPAKAVESRIDNQWNDKKKKKLADFVIENIDLISSKNQVGIIHEILNKDN